MDRDVAKTLLESLVQRIERAPDTGALRLSGAISNNEFEAISEALKLLGAAPIAAPESVGPTYVVRRELSERLNTDALKRDRADGDVVLCLDFGTAMSKAAATLNDSLIVLPLGAHAGDEAEPYGLHSALYISNSGRVHLGHDAIAKNAAEGSAGRRRMSSLKQQLSQGSHEALVSGRPPMDINPTRVPFTYADLVLVYLAYLTDVATSALGAGGYGSRYVSRRFARPCWEPNYWAEGVLGGMLAKAQVVADTFSGQWHEGIPADVLKATIDSVNELQQLPVYLVDRGLPEPVAAAASRVLSEEERDRGMFVVIDVGAGTTDYAVFWTDQDKRVDKYKVWQVDKSVTSIPMAGDSIDDMLQTFILEKGHLRPGGTDYPFAVTRLGRDIRVLKERLMDSGSVEVSLTNGRQVTITRDEFEATEGMKDMEQGLKDRFLSSLRATHESWAQKLSTFKRVGRDEIGVVLTGGGASLGMVQRLADGHVDLHGVKLGLRKAVSVPVWIEERHPEYVPFYARLAVAIGGASRDLPELAPDAGHFDVQGEGAKYEAVSTYKS